MAYRCDQAIFGRATEAIRCKVSGNVCAHQKMCMMEGRTVLTDLALKCPARDGKMPEENQDATKPTAGISSADTGDKKPTAAAAELVKKTARKTAAKAPAKTAAKKTSSRGGKSK